MILYIEIEPGEKQGFRAAVSNSKGSKYFHSPDYVSAKDCVESACYSLIQNSQYWGNILKDGVSPKITTRPIPPEKIFIPKELETDILNPLAVTIVCLHSEKYNRDFFSIKSVNGNLFVRSIVGKKIILTRKPANGIKFNSVDEAINTATEIFQNVNIP